MQLFIRVVKRLIISQIKENAENECIDNFFCSVRNKRMSRKKKTVL